MDYALLIHLGGFVVAFYLLYLSLFGNPFK